MTFVPLFDIPVFWPILLAYFVFLLVGGPAPSIEHGVLSRILLLSR